jgi:hypothetical protein
VTSIRGGFCPSAHLCCSAMSKSCVVLSRLTRWEASEVDLATTRNVVASSTPMPRPRVNDSATIGDKPPVGEWFSPAAGQTHFVLLSDAGTVNPPAFDNTVTMLDEWSPARLRGRRAHCHSILLSCVALAVSTLRATRHVTFHATPHVTLSRNLLLVVAPSVTEPLCAWRDMRVGRESTASDHSAVSF